MTAAELGVLLLCSRPNDSATAPLTTSQFRELGRRVRAHGTVADSPLRELQCSDLTDLGYNAEEAAHIWALLQRESQLSVYLEHARRQNIDALTFLSPGYPSRILQKAPQLSAPVLFSRGDRTLLEQPCVTVIGSRRLLPQNASFAAQTGRLAAEEGFVLVSGGAAGADQTAQNACLDAGGSCIIFVPDALTRYPARERTLYLSADGYQLPFSTIRAFTRNNLIHMQGDRVLAAQCTLGFGGTWQGCLNNLHHGWSPVFVFDDGSRGAAALMERGATGISTLNSIESLQNAQISFL